MVANQGKITTLNDGISGTTGITDGTDKMHSGILKALFAIASGSRVIECGDFTEDTTGSFTTYTLAADIIYTSLGSENTIRANQTVTMTAANASNTRHDLIYIDTDSTMKIKTGNDSATSIVPELDTGEVPVALIEVVGGSADDASHKVQLYLTEINFRDASLIRVKAATGVNISKGEALYISGTHNANVAEVDLAMADSSSTMPCIGVAYSDLASGEEGFAVVLGKANGIAADPSSFNAGDTLYVSPTVAGALTNTKPTSASHLIQNVGILFNPHLTNASVKITGVGRTNDVPNRTFVTQGSDDLENSYQLQGGTGISLAAGGSGSSKTLTVTNDSPDQTITLTDGTGITTSGTYPNFTITNSAPDQTVSLTGGGITAVTGTYPNFTITSTEDDTLDDVTGRGATTSNNITVGNATMNTATINTKLNLSKIGALDANADVIVQYIDASQNTPAHQYTLPAASTVDGSVYIIKNLNASNNMNILPTGSDVFENNVISTDARYISSTQLAIKPLQSVMLQAVTDSIIIPLVPTPTTLASGWMILETDTGGGGSEVNDLTASVTWADVPDANITESSVTQHREAIQDRVIVETGNDSPASSATESGNYFYRASGETNTFNIPNDSYVGEYYVLMNNSGSSITIDKDAGDTLIGSTSISDGSAATIICVAANTWFVVG